MWLKSQCGLLLSVLIPIGTRQRQLCPAPVVEFCQEGLIDSNMTAPEAVAGASQIETPHAVGLLRNKCECGAVGRFEPPQPMLQREPIVFSQIFYVANLEAGRFGGP